MLFASSSALKNLSSNHDDKTNTDLKQQKKRLSEKAASFFVEKYRTMPE